MAKRLYVGNLPYSVRDAELSETFASFGAVKYARVVMEQDSGRSRGFGFVEMEDDAAADAAIAGLHGKALGQRNLVVNEARPMTERPAFGDRPPRPPRDGGYGPREGGFGGPPREGGRRFGGNNPPRDGGFGGNNPPRDGGGGRRFGGGGGYTPRDGGGQGGFNMPPGGEDGGWRSPYGRQRRQDRPERDRRDRDYGDEE